jgi:hypothetical protein
MNTFCFHITNGDRTYTAKVQADTVAQARATMTAGLRDGESILY